MENSVHELINESFAAEQSVKQAQLAYEEKLSAVVKALGGATFQHNGKWYQIRTRDSKEEGRIVTYLCYLSAEPKTWLKGRPKGANRSDRQETPMEAMSTAFATIPDSATVTDSTTPTTTVIE